MAKTYGGRWRGVEGNLGEGGQGTVHPVFDLTGKLAGEYALKRVKNPKRHDRFRSEIEAIKRLDHPNIIKLIDHSALDIEGGPEEKQYLVMPIAAGRDLGKPERVAPYRDSIDSVLQVAMPLALALGVAHEADVIHRDVKPENILFTGNGHEIWLSDFGICLLRDQERFTPDDEVVGPVAFMAPELEGGGQLDVTPAADVYSLGKVIYFMISGGIVLPRERLNEAQFAQVLSGGGRKQLLHLLLGDMICELPSRIKTMAEITRRLSEISEWDTRSVMTSLSPAGQSAIQSLQKRSYDSRKVVEQNTANRTAENERLQNVRSSVVDWLRLELEKTAAAIRTSEVKAVAREMQLPKDQPFNIRYSQNSAYRVTAGYELALEITPMQAGTQHKLMLLFCEQWTATVTSVVHIWSGPFREPPPQVTEMRDPILAVVAHYSKRSANSMPVSAEGFLSEKSAVGRPGTTLVPQPRGRSIPRTEPVSPVTKSFQPQISIAANFKLSEWPGVIDALSAMLGKAVEAFVDLTDVQFLIIGP